MHADRFSIQPPTHQIEVMRALVNRQSAGPATLPIPPQEVARPMHAIDVVLEQNL
jgi:hypothetical protein